MKPAAQKRLRDLHNWFGVFFAPGIIFFAFSGIFQTLGLHESGPGRQPAAPFIGVLASIHKEGEAALPKRRFPPPTVSGKPAERSPEHVHRSGFPLFKIYALLLCVALIASAAMGIAVALANRVARGRTWALLAAGCVIPLTLLAIRGESAWGGRATSSAPTALLLMIASRYGEPLIGLSAVSIHSRPFACTSTLIRNRHLFILRDH